MTRLASAALAALSLLAPLSVSADTEVCGTLPLATEWTAKESPYLVTGDVFIPLTSRLRIGPGVVVRFALPKPCPADSTRIPQADWSDSAYAGIKAEGTFYALGSEEKPIVFEPAPRKGAPLRSGVGWDGLRLSGHNANRAEIAFAIFRGANQAITAEKASFYVHHSLFEGNNTGLYLGLRGDLTVVNCAFVHNLSAGIVIRKAGPRIVNTMFSGNNGYGIWGDGRNLAKIGYNAFWKSGEEDCYRCPYPALIPDSAAKDTAARRADLWGNRAADPLFVESPGHKAAQAADPRTPTPAHLVKDPALAEMEAKSRSRSKTPKAFKPLGAGPYLLSEYSPLIDAGHPGRGFRDRDGSRNDIGLHGGTMGRITQDPF